LRQGLADGRELRAHLRPEVTQLQEQTIEVLVDGAHAVIEAVVGPGGAPMVLVY